MEFDHSEIYAPVDLKVGKCRLSVAGPKELVASEPNAVEPSEVPQNIQISQKNILPNVEFRLSALN